MKDEKLFDYLENADDSEIKIIMKNTPELSKSKLDRIIAMSERKYEMKKNNDSEEINMNNMVFTPEVSGVENYNRPFIVKILGFAAGFAVVAGMVTIGSMILKNGGGRAPEQPPQPLITAITSTTETVTETTSTESAISGTGTTSANNETFTAESGIYTTVSGTYSSESAAVSASSQTNNKAENDGLVIEGRDNNPESLRYIQIAKELFDMEAEYSCLGSSVDLTDSFNITVQDYMLDADTGEYIDMSHELTFYRVTDEKCNTLEKYREYRRKVTYLNTYPEEVEDSIYPGCVIQHVAGTGEPECCEYNGKLYINPGVETEYELEHWHEFDFERIDTPVVVKKRPDMAEQFGASEAIEYYIGSNYPNAGELYFSKFYSKETTHASKYIIANFDGEWRIKFKDGIYYSDYEAMWK